MIEKKNFEFKSIEKLKKQFNNVNVIVTII